MSQEYKVDFATFCHAGDAHRLHKVGQLQTQIKSNVYEFDTIFIVYQNCCPRGLWLDFQGPVIGLIIKENDIDELLKTYGINKKQYTSTTDKAHYWKYHVVNHLKAISKTTADYIVFADNDCWIVRQPPDQSWIDRGIELLRRHDCFIVSPNDGEPERKTRRMSQQMFLARVEDFRNADFNQPDWDGNVNVPGGPMPEYWAMLEGRMELYCRAVGKYRYVLGPEYRYWHFNRLKEDGHFETDMSKYSE
jgi:hypothetical protein